MDRKRALEILGLTESATEDDINKRMDVLYRKMRNLDRDEDGNTLEDMDKAYRTLKGITFRDKEEEEKKKYRAKHPNPFFKLLGLDEDKVRNLIYYYKWHAIIALIAIGIVTSIILSIVNRVVPNLKIIIAKEIFVHDTLPFEELIESELDDVKEVQVQNIYLTENTDPQFEIAYRTKLIVEIAEGRNDMFVMDENTYKEFAAQGLFIPLNDRLDELDIDMADHEDLITEIDLDDGNTYSPMLYGLDVTDSALFKDSGISAERIIVSLCERGENLDNAWALLKKLLD